MLSRSRRCRSRHILARARVRARAIETFCLQLESEPEPCRKVLALAPKERKKQKENSKRAMRKRRIHHSHCSVSQFSRTGKVEWAYWRRYSCSSISGEEHIASELHSPACLEIIDYGVLRLWRHNGWILLYQGRLGPSNRGEASSFISFTRLAASTHTHWLLTSRRSCRGLQCIVRWNIDCMK